MEYKYIQREVSNHVWYSYLTRFEFLTNYQYDCVFLFLEVLKLVSFLMHELINIIIYDVYIKYTLYLL